MSSDESLGDENSWSVAEPDEGGRSGTDRSRDELVVELERLRERNRRLQETYTLAKKSQYERTALGLATLGVLAVGGAVLVPDLQTILLTLGAIGLFGGLLTYYLTPERFVAEDVGRGVYQAIASDRADLTAELGLTDTRLYVPVGEASARTRLFVPQHEEYVLPDEAELEHSLVVPAETSGRGAAFTPSGEPLYESCLDSLSGHPPDRPQPLITRLTEALVEQFELVARADTDYDPTENRLTVRVSDAVYGPADRFDNPVVSLYAVGLARGLDSPVTVDVDAVTEGRGDYLLTYRWGDVETLRSDSR